MDRNGPPGRHIVLLYRPQAGDDSGEFKGTVLLGRERPQQLPPLALIPNQFAIEVKAVFFEQAVGGIEPELLISMVTSGTGLKRTTATPAPSTSGLATDLSAFAVRKRR